MSEIYFNFVSKKWLFGRTQRKGGGLCALTWLQPHVCVHVHVCMYVHVRVCVHVHACMCMHVCVCVRVHVYACVYVRICARVCMCAHVRIYVCACVCVHVAACTPFKDWHFCRQRLAVPTAPGVVLARLPA